MRIYKIGKGWAWFIYIFATLIILLFCWLAIMPFVLEDTAVETAYYLIPISIAVIGLMILGILDVKIGSTVVKEDSISVKSVFNERSLKFEEIKGFKIEDNYIRIFPKNNAKKQLKVNSFIANKDEFIFWLTHNFTNLDEDLYDKEHTEIVENSEFGMNEEERSEKLNKASIITKIYSWLGGLTLVWTLFFPEPYYEYAILASVTVMVSAILVLIYFKGLIRINDIKGSAYPTIFFGVFTSIIGITLRALQDFNIYDYSNSWMPASIIAVVLIVLIVFATNEFKFEKIKDYFTVLFFAVLFFAFGYGTTITFNCMYDQSIPKYFKSKVVEKRISSGKYGDTYYIEVTAWHTQTESDDISVSKELYETTTIGDDIDISLKKGLLGIPWFLVDKRK